MRLVGCPETSVLNHLMPRNNPEDGRIQIPTFSKIVLPSSGSSTILRNVCIHIPERTASLPRRLVSSTVIILIVTVITISKRNVSECRIYHLELVYDGWDGYPRIPSLDKGVDRDCHTILSGVKRLDSQARHWPLFAAQVRTQWSYTSSLVCLLDMRSTTVRNLQGTAAYRIWSDVGTGRCAQRFWGISRKTTFWCTQKETEKCKVRSSVSYRWLINCFY